MKIKNEIKFFDLNLFSFRLFCSRRHRFCSGARARNSRKWTKTRQKLKKKYCQQRSEKNRTKWAHESIQNKRHRQATENRTNWSSEHLHRVINLNFESERFICCGSTRKSHSQNSKNRKIVSNFLSHIKSIEETVENKNGKQFSMLLLFEFNENANAKTRK